MKTTLDPAPSLSEDASVSTTQTSSFCVQRKDCIFSTRHGSGGLQRIRGHVGNQVAGSRDMEMSNPPERRAHPSGVFTGKQPPLAAILPARKNAEHNRGGGGFFFLFASRNTMLDETTVGGGTSANAAAAPG